jgi:hypothetical protein
MKISNNYIESQLNKWVKGLSAVTLKYLRKMLDILLVAQETHPNRDAEISLKSLSRENIPRSVLVSILDSLSILGVITIYSGDGPRPDLPLVGFVEDSFKLKDCRFKINMNRLMVLDPLLTNLGQEEKSVEKLLPQKEISCCDLTYDISTCELSYKNGKKIEVGSETDEIKFFLMLFSNKGHVVDYKIVAKELNIRYYKKLIDEQKYSYNEIENIFLTKEIGDVRKKLRKHARKAGMPEKEFNTMIANVSRRGYKLRC